MKLTDVFIITFMIIGLASASLITNDTIGKQQTQIEQLTDRVLLLETAMSDKSGIKPEKTK